MRFAVLFVAGSWQHLDILSYLRLPYDAIRNHTIFRLKSFTGLLKDFVYHA